MNILDLIPDTLEWKEFRRKHIGASDTPAICGVDPYRTAMQVWESKMFGKDPYVTAAMQRGHDLEPEARKTFCEINPNRFFARVVGQSMEREHMIASFDGYSVGSGEFVEIKCPNFETYEKCSSAVIPKHYIYQIQHQIYVCGANYGSLAVYYPGHLLSVITIFRDEKIIQEILDKCDAFWECMVNNVPPKAPIPHIEEEELEETIGAWQEDKRLHNHVTEKLGISRDSVLYVAKGRELTCKGVTIKKVIQPGVVDYSKIPELKGVDLTPYRGKPIEKWVMTWKDPQD